MPTLAGIDYSTLTKDDNVPSFALRRDVAACTRRYTVRWDKALAFAHALRGYCVETGTDDTADSYFSRDPLPHFFYWQPGGDVPAGKPFMCVDVPEIKPAGWLTEKEFKEREGEVPEAGDGSFPTEAASEDDDYNITFNQYDKAHITADYQAVRYVIASDDDTNEAVGTVTPGVSGSGAGGDTDATRDNDGKQYEEWDRFTDWKMEWGSEILQAPLGSYVYSNVDGTPPLSQQINIVTSMATVTAKVWGLPIIPPSSFRFVNCVNQVAKTIFLSDRTVYTFAPETLLLHAPVVEECVAANGAPLFNMIYRFTYRAQRHNKFIYINPTTRSASFERIAIDPSNEYADGSAPFSLRNMGYLWSPRTPA